MLTHGLASTKDLKNSDSFTNSLGSPRVSFHAPEEKKPPFLLGTGGKKTRGMS